MANEPIEDEILVENALNGDQASLVELLSRHRDHILRIAKYTVPEDLRNVIGVDDFLQDLFVILTKSLAAYDASRGTPSQWLGGVTRNKVRELVRLVRRERGRRIDAKLGENDEETDDWLTGTAEAPSDENPVRQARLNEIRSTVEGLLERLPEQDRILLQRCQLKGERHAELAVELGISSTAVSMRLLRIRDRCLELLLAENDYFTTAYPRMGHADEQSA